MRDKRKKGCCNPNCSAFKTIRVNSDESFCSKCGTQLVYVCVKCGTPLAVDDINVKTCVKCQAKAADKKEKIIKAGKTIMGVVPGVVSLVVTKKIKK